MPAPSKGRHGLAGFGTWLMDHVRIIDAWPEEETLVNVLDQRFSGGGLAHNFLMDVAAFGMDIPLEAIGLVGNDDDGRTLIDTCRSSGIDTTHLHTTRDAPTSYTEVMTVQATGRRTYFHSRGANNLLNYDTVSFDSIRSRIVHFGYLLLMDGIDAPDAEYGTVAAKMLHRLQHEGIKTSVDAVSEQSDRFSTLVPPALKYADFAILNEFEAGQTTGHAIMRGDALDAGALRDSAKRLMELGSSELVVIHLALGAYALTRDGFEWFQPAFDLPAGYAKGAAGAGDAFCAGLLAGIHEGWDLREGLRFGTAAAAQSMSDATCTGGMKTHDEIMTLFDRFPLRRPAIEC